MKTFSWLLVSLAVLQAFTHGAVLDELGSLLQGLAEDQIEELSKTLTEEKENEQSIQEENELLDKDEFEDEKDLGDDEDFDEESELWDYTERDLSDVEEHADELTLFESGPMKKSDQYLASQPSITARSKAAQAHLEATRAEKENIPDGNRQCRGVCRRIRQIENVAIPDLENRLENPDVTCRIPFHIPNGNMKCSNQCTGRLLSGEKLSDVNCQIFCEKDFLPSALDFTCQCNGAFDIHPACKVRANFASNKKTSQSSTFTNLGISSKAVDGCLKTDFFLPECGCTETNSEVSPWWGVDLHTIIDVEFVSVTNRGDCCGDRLSDFQILVSEDNINPLVATQSVLCNERVGTVPQGATEIFSCLQASTGRFVSILIPGENKRLTLCEVRVFGQENNLALNKETSQSSTNTHLGISPKAVDGCLETGFFVPECGCTETNFEVSPWWGVDLHKIFDVEFVSVINRGDCCGDRLSDFQILVLEDNINPLVATQSVLCNERVGTVPQGATEIFSCLQASTGRFVSILIPGENKRLTLCEVKVFGKDPI